jgi:tetratricopeptide (TPR) repeat protein
MFTAPVARTLVRASRVALAALPNTWLVSLALFSCLLAFALSTQDAHAALDPESKSPYQLRVVLQIAEHRMLTPLFKEELKTSLRNQLQLALGKLAHVEVINAHPLLSDIRTKGLQAVLDAWNEISPQQTHFVLVDYADGQYLLETGNHDGMTGLSNGAVRKQALPDRQRVADAAAEMVRKSFGVVGTFQKLGKLEGKEVEVTLKGGDLGEPLDGWVQSGDVFALVRVGQAAGKPRVTPIEWAVLRATESPRGGTVRCRYFCRLLNDKDLPEQGPGAGYRCIKLDTRRGPVRVRLVDENLVFMSGQVQVSTNEDFIGELDNGVTLKGLYETSQSYGGVAYVRILTGAKVLAEFPVAIVNDRAIVCRVWSLSADAVKQGEIEDRKERWIRWIEDALDLQRQLVKEYEAALRTPKNTKESLTAALKLGQKHLKTMDDEVSRLKDERKNLVDFAGKYRVNLEYGDQRAEAFNTQKKDLAESLAVLAKRLNDANSDEALEMGTLLSRAELLEKQADFEQALQLYERVLKTGAKLNLGTGEVKKRFDRLKRDWMIQSPDHEEARHFIYEEWPSLDLQGVKANLAKAKASLQHCKDAGDRKTPLKLLLVMQEHMKTLNAALEALRRLDDEDALARFKGMRELGNALKGLQSEAASWISSN